MLAAALAVAVLSARGHRAEVFGRRLQVFGFAVAVVLLAAIAFIPVVAWLLWLVVLAVFQLRLPRATAAS